MAGHFARKFDLIASEYGWSDEHIGNLTLRRFRQVVATISQRKTLESTEQRILLSWQTRTLVTYLVSTGMNADEHLMELARTTAFDRDEAEVLRRSYGPEGRSRTRENSPGSFELLTGTLGR